MGGNMELNDMLSKGAKAQSAQELKEIAAMQDWHMTDEEAGAYFDELKKHGFQPQGELSDDELDDVSGGGCYSKGQLVVSALHSCDKFECKCGRRVNNHTYELMGDNKGHCRYCGVGQKCGNCKHCSYERGLWLCNHPQKIRK